MGGAGQQAAGKTLRLCWRWIAAVAALIVVLGALLVVAIGQESRWVAYLVYAPPLIGPVVLAVLALPGLVWRERLAAVLLTAALILAVPWLGWRSHRPPPISLASGVQSLRCVTCNRGQNYGHSLEPFFQETRPDIVAVQDVATEGFRTGFAGLPYVNRAWEFVLFSRYPVIRSELLSLVYPPTGKNPQVWRGAARFLLRVGEREVVVYNVHLPSPRHALTGADEAGFVVGDFWELQRLTLEQLASAVQKETLPTLVLGDLNLVPLGPRYRRITARLTDVHAAGGLGYGFTAPNDVNTLWAFRSAWLRLDYVLASPHWQVLSSLTEPASKSQHAALFAELALR